MYALLTGSSTDRNQRLIESLGSARELLVSGGALWVPVSQLRKCASLLRDDALVKWCDFHLGMYSGVIPSPPRSLKLGFEEYTKLLFDEYLPKAELDPKIFRMAEIVPRVHLADSAWDSVKILESIFMDVNESAYMLNLDRALTATRTQALRRVDEWLEVLVFSGHVSGYFDTVQRGTDEWLLAEVPGAAEVLQVVHENLTSDSPEKWSLALAGCRRLLKNTADSLYPPDDSQEDGSSLDDAHYLNRLRAWATKAEAALSQSDKKVSYAHLEYLGGLLTALNKKCSKGDHAQVGHGEATRTVLHIYLVLGDMAEIQKAIRPRELRDSSLGVSIMFGDPDEQGRSLVKSLSDSITGTRSDGKRPG